MINSSFPLDVSNLKFPRKSRQVSRAMPNIVVVFKMGNDIKENLEKKTH